MYSPLEDSVVIAIKMTVCIPLAWHPTPGSVSYRCTCTNARLHLNRLLVILYNSKNGGREEYSLIRISFTN